MGRQVKKLDRLTEGTTVQRALAIMGYWFIGYIIVIVGAFVVGLVLGLLDLI